MGKDNLEDLKIQLKKELDAAVEHLRAANEIRHQVSADPYEWFYSKTYCDEDERNAQWEEYENEDGTVTQRYFKQKRNDVLDKFCAAVDRMFPGAWSESSLMC